MKRHRNSARGHYCIPHRARCKVCREEQVFYRGERDKQRGRVGHVKHMHCYTCGRITMHVQLGELVA